MVYVRWSERPGHCWHGSARELLAEDRRFGEVGALEHRRPVVWPSPSSPLWRLAGPLERDEPAPLV